MTAAPAETTALAPAEAPAPGPQFARGFDGMATAPFPDETRRVLAEAVNPRDVEIKPDGIVFLPGVAYRRILTRAFGAGGWAIAPRSPARYMKDNNIIVYHGALFCLGRFVAEAVGECFYRDNNPNMSYASCVEGAKTDALSRCCKDLGIATEMWDANWREKWKAEYATTYKQKDRNGEEKTKWKLKNRVSNPHDLMAGAGGVAPAPTAAATESARPGSASSTAAAAPEPASSPSTDTGEAATDEQKEAIKAQFKRLAFKGGYIKMWIAQTFGLQVADARRAPEVFSQRQADAAFTLLLAHGTALYDKVYAELKGKGDVA